MPGAASALASAMTKAAVARLLDIGGLYRLDHGERRFTGCCTAGYCMEGSDGCVLHFELRDAAMAARAAAYRAQQDAVAQPNSRGRMRSAIRRWH